MDGNASRGRRSPAFLIALRTKGETVEEIAGLARTMRALADARRRRRARRPARHVGHRRRAPDVQRLDHRRVHRRGRRLRGRQARQPLGHRASPAPPTCWRRSARASTSTPDAVGRCIDEVGFGFMFAPPHHPATRHVPGAQGARRAHDLQLPRPAHEPGRRDAPADRRRRPALPGAIARRARAARRGAACSSSPATTASTSSTSAPTRVVEVRDGDARRLHASTPRGRRPRRARSRTS